MENLPNEINREILKFTYRCRKEERLIFNKESHEIFRNITRDCKHVKLLGKIYANAVIKRQFGE